MGKKVVFFGILIFALSFSNSYAEELPAQAQVSTFTLAYQGPLTGPESEIGIAEYTGVKFAVTKFAASNPKMNIRVIVVDDQGHPEIASQVAPAVASDMSIIGLIGPAYTATTRTSIPFYKPAGLPLISPSAGYNVLTDPSEPENGIPIFHRVIPTTTSPGSLNISTSEGSILIRRAASQTPVNKIFIVRDDLNLPLANDLVATLSALGSTIDSTITLGSSNLTDSDFSQAAATLLSGGAASVIFAGYSAFNAAGVVRALKVGGYSGKYFVSSLTNPTQFKDLAGSYGNNAEFTTDYIPLKDASPSLAREFVTKMGSQPGLFATEAINATNIFLSGIKAGVTTRQGMSNYIDTYKGTGIAGNVIQFTAYGELSNPSWGTYTIINSQLVYKGPISVSTFAKKIAQTITFAPPSSLTSAQFPYALTATASSGLPVTITSSATGVCTVSGQTLTLVSAGRCTLAAIQVGNIAYEAARSITKTINLTKATQTITFTPPTSLTSAQFPYTLTTTASSGLPVTITSSTTGVCTISGQTLTLVTAGRCTLTASQAGNEIYGPARSVTRSISLSKTTQTITFAPPTSITLNQSPYLLTATASSGLTVSLVSSTTSICTVTGATLTLVTAGTCTLTASQAGDSTYSAAPLVTRSITLSKATQTITFAPPTSLTSAQFPYTLTTTASSGLPVTITSITTGICTISGVTLTMVTTGTCTLSASQGGDEDYFEANSVVRNMVLNKITQTIDFTPSNSINLDQTPYTLVATASSGLPVTITSSTTGICTVSGFTLTLVTTGTCTLSASQSGNAIYESTSFSQDIIIRSKPSVVIRPGLISNGSPLIVGSFARIDCLTSGCGSPYGKWTGVPNSFTYQVTFEICDGETCSTMEKSEVSITRTRYVLPTEQNFCIRATLVVSNAAGSTELKFGPNCVAESVNLLSYGTLNWKNSSPVVGEALNSSGITWSSYNGPIQTSGIVLRCSTYVTNQVGIPPNCIQVALLESNSFGSSYTITPADEGFYLTIMGVARFGNVTKYATVTSTNIIPSS